MLPDPVSAADDVEGAVLDHVQKLLATPGLVARTWAMAKRADQNHVAEREVTTLLAGFASVWTELDPAEQARILRLLVERIDVAPDGIAVTLHAGGIRSLVAELASERAELDEHALMDAAD